ncbi:BRO family protein [Clostridioides difficile]|uniref:BRO family protein n=1 Tax=Clostridioides difficile TaxID=1496 RepID=UPI000D1E7AAF|nr:BRO family protein [Clostridioides difficile]MBY2845912.1 BRO family protein [Clostridioides difficile]MCI0947915.1 BRO family protein [Clostridioides difficile]MCW0785082.1 BRO family protein [Clostridioides difficile]MDE3445681.1 BRO family protein [Clostridioides difficile]MDO0133125.1 BRO family protein [Clostridioides difficile]
MLKILQEKNVRMIWSKDGSEVWFHAGDVGEELGVIQINSTLRNINSKYKKKITNEFLKVHDMHYSNFKELYRTGEIFIKPHAVYNIAFRSNKPEAKLFTEWATEVIDQIRIRGYYIATEKDQEWLDIRTEGKKVRKDFTDEIQEFVYYATSQGSNKPQMYYKHFTELVRKKLCIPKGVKRDELNQSELFDIQALERIISMKLPKLIDKDMNYKEVYKKIKELIEMI